MRLGCFGIIIVGVLLWGGGQATYVAVTNRTITEVTIDEVIKEKPSAKWLRVTEGQIDLLGSVYEESVGGTITDLYIPIISKDGNRDQYHVLYHTQEPKYLDTSKKLRDLSNDEKLTQEEVLLKIAELGEELFAEINIEGLVEFGIDSDDGEDEAKQLFDNLATGAIMLEAGEEPSIGFGITMLSIGLLGLFFILRGMRSKE